jgi:hypothetical protein
MRAPRLTAFVLTHVILLAGRLHAQAQTEDDTLARAWELGRAVRRGLSCKAAEPGGRARG